MANSPSGRYFPVEIMHFGQTGRVATFNESVLNNGGAGPWLGNLGQIIEDGGALYRLVQFNSGNSAIAAAAGQPAYWYTRASSIATSQYNSTGSGDTLPNSNAVAGAWLQAQTTLYYAFVQMGGLQNVGCTTNAAVGTTISGTASNTQFVATAMGVACVGIPVGVTWVAGSSNVIGMYWNVGSMIG